MWGMGVAQKPGTVSVVGDAAADRRGCWEGALASPSLCRAFQAPVAGESGECVIFLGNGAEQEKG